METGTRRCCPTDRHTIREMYMHIAGLDKTEKVKVDMEGAKNTWVQRPVSSADGAPNFSFRVFTVEPEGYTPYHTHAWEHVNYIISGQGALVDETGTQRPVEQGDCCLVLPEEKHQYRNTSADQPLVFICAVPKEYE
jgi:quercetin dioxygenase-like cupin family protein